MCKTLIKEKIEFSFKRSFVRVTALYSVNMNLIACEVMETNDKNISFVFF